MTGPASTAQTPHGWFVYGRVQSAGEAPARDFVWDVGDAQRRDTPAMEHLFLLPDSEPDRLANDRNWLERVAFIDTA